MSIMALKSSACKTLESIFQLKRTSPMHIRFLTFQHVFPELVQENKLVKKLVSVLRIGEFEAESEPCDSPEEAHESAASKLLKHHERDVLGTDFLSMYLPSRHYLSAPALRLNHKRVARICTHFGVRKPQLTFQINSMSGLFTGSMTVHLTPGNNVWKPKTYFAMSRESIDQMYCDVVSAFLADQLPAVMQDVTRVKYAYVLPNNWSDVGWKLSSSVTEFLDLALTTAAKCSGHANKVDVSMDFEFNLDNEEDALLHMAMEGHTMIWPNCFSSITEQERKKLLQVLMNRNIRKIFFDKTQDIQWIKTMTGVPPTVLFPHVTDLMVMASQCSPMAENAGFKRMLLYFLGIRSQDLEDRFRWTEARMGRWCDGPQHKITENQSVYCQIESYLHLQLCKAIQKEMSINKNFR